MNTGISCLTKLILTIVLTQRVLVSFYIRKQWFHQEINTSSPMTIILIQVLTVENLNIFFLSAIFIRR